VRSPAEPGSNLTLRRYRGGDDLAGMAALINARDERDGVGGEHVTAEAMADVYNHLQRCDPDTDLVVAEDGDGAMVGYARVQWDDWTEGVRSYWMIFENDPSRPDVETELLDWAEARALAVAVERPAARRRLHAEAMVGSRREALLVGRGLRPIRYSAIMIRPHLDSIPDRPLPAGVAARPVVDGDLRAIWEADIEAFRDHFGYVEQTEADWEKFRDSARRGTELWQVAWAGDVVVAQVRTHETPGEAERIGRRRAWTEDISTRREWRRQGIASALICNSLRQLRDLGFDEAALGADTRSLTGAFDLYASLGYEQVTLGAIYERVIDEE
jgi:predicted N-acetyltransferase YhbS